MKSTLIYLILHDHHLERFQECPVLLKIFDVDRYSVAGHERTKGFVVVPSFLLDGDIFMPLNRNCEKSYLKYL